MLDINEKTIRSYKTKANLKAAIANLGFTDPFLDRHIVVCREDGRYTAIFSSFRFRHEGGYIGLYAQHGFVTI